MKNILESVRKQRQFAIKKTDFNIGKKYEGKVRDVYDLGDKLLLLTTDRISAFDNVLGIIPFKGEILNALSLFWFENTKDIINNHIISVLHPNAILVQKCKILPIEIIIRGYLTGGGWREYSKTNMVSGIKLPSGLQKNCKLESPIFTPTTKAETGHDESITKEEIIKQNIISEKLLDKIEKTAFSLFKRGTEIAKKNNLILVDTKYEFGLTANDELIVADEIHTPDSSRYWFLDSYQKAFQSNTNPKALDKEYFRNWLMKNDLKDKNDIGEIPIDIISNIVERYLLTHNTITGKEYKLKVHDSNKELLEIIKSINV